MTKPNGSEVHFLYIKPDKSLMVDITDSVNYWILYDPETKLIIDSNVPLLKGQILEENGEDL